MDVFSLQFSEFTGTLYGAPQALPRRRWPIVARAAPGLTAASVALWPIAVQGRPQALRRPQTKRFELQSRCESNPNTLVIHVWIRLLDNVRNGPQCLMDPLYFVAVCLNLYIESMFLRHARLFLVLCVS